MSSYKQPCRYCGQLVPPDSNVCPFCGKVNPTGSLRCARCRNPVQKGEKVCGDCGLSLEIPCPKCGKATFFGDYCEQCGSRLTVICPKCKKEQPPLGPNCINCGRPLKEGVK